MASQFTVRSHERVAVVGAGMLGVASAWFLRRAGLDVTIVDGATVAAGASWGNAGWVTPSLAAPLPEPSILRYGMRALMDPRSPVFVPPSLDPVLWRFLGGFLVSSTGRKWERSMDAYAPLNRLASDAFSEIEDAVPTALGRRSLPLLAACETEREHEALLAELRAIQRHGIPVDAESLSGDQARAEEPSLGDGVSSAIRLLDQSFVDPGHWICSLAQNLQSSGVEVRENWHVESVAPTPRGVTLRGRHGEELVADVVVIASGAWIRRLARPLGVRTVVQAGRGYSFSVASEGGPNIPVYLPGRRVACSPWRGRLRIAGMMELRRPDAARDPRRIEAIVDSIRPLLSAVDVDSREDEWVGSRPCTPDGMPIIGCTADPRVYVAGGHGMWGITLGPATGKLLAHSIISGSVPDELQPFDPLR